MATCSLPPNAATRLTNTIPGQNEDLDNLDPVRAPALVSPAVLFMCRDDAPTGKVVQAGGGQFSFASLFNNAGVSHGGDASLEKLIEDQEEMMSMENAQEGWNIRRQRSR